MPDEIALQPVARHNVRVLAADKILLAIATASGDSAFVLRPDQLNPLIEAMIIASLDPQLTSQRESLAPSLGGAERVLTFPLERIAASHAPTKGTVSVVMTLLSGLRAAFEMSPQESLVLANELQAAAGRAQIPISPSHH
jgi:hypothetical protein